jgi:hydroxymethylbilane synthase
MGFQKLTLASRQSPLAKTQVEEVRRQLTDLPNLPELSVEFMDTPGDRDRTTPLDDPSTADDIFTRDLDRALLEGRVDVTVHSAKDLPEVLPDGLSAIRLPAKDIRDALVCREGVAPNEETSFVVGSSSPRRAENIGILFPKVELKAIRGNIESRIEQLDSGEYDAVIIAACALERLGLTGRITSYLPYDPAPQQGRLALVWRSEDKELGEWLRPLSVRETSGLIALVGCPADSEYLNQKTLTYLEKADVVIHDRLIPDEILESIQHKALPVGKEGKEKSVPQSEIHRRMLVEAEKGRLVVRLHGGDPCIYGHLNEELEFLRDWDLRYDIVTSVTAAQVASAHAGAPLTHRGDTGDITFIPGYKAKGEELNFPGPHKGNLAVYMGVTTMREVQAGLKNSGWLDDAPVVVGQRLGYRDEKIRHTTLGEVADLEVSRPAVFLVGTKSFPAQGWTLFVGTDSSNFLQHGPLIHWPLLRLEPQSLEDRVQALKEALPTADGLIFPSRFAVDAMMDALMEIGDSRLLAGKTLLSVGPATTDHMKSLGLRADASVDHYGGVQSLVEESGADINGRFLYPCSDASPRQSRIDTLAGVGIELIPVQFYRNRNIDYDFFPGLPIRRVLFTSGSTVKRYFELYPEELSAERDWLAVGPSTLKALQDKGLEARTISGPK